MVDGPDEQPEKRIIVDEDWKSQVEREREEARQKKQEEPVAAADGDAVEAVDGAATPPGPEGLPPASFEQVVSMLASSAMVFLGEIPDPNRDERVVDLPIAQHYIGLLEVLGEKTKGNLSPEENGMLQTVTYQLRMAFVAAAEAAKGGSAGA